jgi:hypothetical protein
MKNKQLKDWLIQIYCHFQSMTTQIFKTKKQCQQSYVNTICKSVRVTILIIFQFARMQMLSPTKGNVQTTYMRLQTAENYTSSCQTHVTEVINDMCDN